MPVAAARSRRSPPALRASFQQDMSYWGAHDIVAGPGTRPALTAFIRQLVQRPPLRTGGVLLWRD